MQFWPPDDEHMCSKHVEAWNELIVKQKFCASSWLITKIKKLICVYPEPEHNFVLLCFVDCALTLRGEIVDTSQQGMLLNRKAVCAVGASTRHACCCANTNSTFLSNVVPVRSFVSNGLGAGRRFDGHLIEVWSHRFQENIYLVLAWMKCWIEVLDCVIGSFR